MLVHDAARPFASAALVSRTIAAAAASGAAVAALPASDTVKQASEDGRFVRTTLARDTIFLAQTPQAFRREVLADAIALGRSGFEATDEAMLAERAGHPRADRGGRAFQREDYDCRRSRGRASRAGAG